MLRNLLLLVAVAIAALCDIRGQDVHVLSGDHTAEIDKLMSTLNERGQFNGAILVAERGKMIYRKAFGKANFSQEYGLFP